MGTHLKLDLPENVRKDTAARLQAILVNLIDVALQAKQAHWNIKGRGFRTVHLHLDEIVAELRAGVDDIAERITTLGFPADGRSSTVAAEREVEEFPAGFIDAFRAVGLISSHMAKAVNKARAHIEPLEVDPVSQDLIISVVAKLEKQHWMLASQLEDAN